MKNLLFYDVEFLESFIEIGSIRHNFKTSFIAPAKIRIILFSEFCQKKYLFIQFNIFQELISLRSFNSTMLQLWLVIMKKRLFDKSIILIYNCIAY